MAAVVVAAVRPDVVWCNTVLSACYVRPARLLRRSVVLHAHEPASRISHTLERYHLDGYWEDVTLVGCSPTVSSDLATATGRPVESVLYLPSVPNHDRVLTLAGTSLPTLPPGRLVIGGCGTADWRKGVDLWLQMIEIVAPKLEDLDPLFLWVGGSSPEGFTGLHSTLRARVHFVEQVDNPYPWLAALDIFVLTSRSDPFPLVVLEAMVLGKPVVAFSVGSVAEQVGDAGVLVPPLAVESLAGAVAVLGRDPAARKRLGNEARRRVEEKFSAEVFGRDVNWIASSVLSKRSRPGPSAAGAR